jgi:hypothetical protein
VVETVHTLSLVVVAPAGRGVVRFAVGGVKTADHATGEKVRLLGDYEVSGTDDYGQRTLFVLYEVKPDAKDAWKHERAMERLRRAKDELDAARVGIEKSAATEPRPRPATEAPKPPDPKAEAERLTARKATYVKIIGALDQVEAAAVRKFGRKPKADDLAGFTVPYKLFVERETAKALDALSKDLRLSRSELNAIRMEGDAEGWPKK